MVLSLVRVFTSCAYVHERDEFVAFFALYLCIEIKTPSMTGITCLQLPFNWALEQAGGRTVVVNVLHVPYLGPIMQHCWRFLHWAWLGWAPVPRSRPRAPNPANRSSCCCQSTSCLKRPKDLGVDAPSANLTVSYGKTRKSTIWKSKSLINGPFSMAMLFMLDCRRGIFGTQWWIISHCETAGCQR